MMARALVCALFAVSTQLAAQQYPVSQISMIVPLAAGDASDTAARAIGDALERAIRSPEIVARLKPLGIPADYSPPERLLAR